MFFCRGFRQPVLPSGLSRLRLSPPTGGTGPGPAPPFAFGTAAAPKPFKALYCGLTANSCFSN